MLGMRPLLSVLAMIIVAPVVAATTLVAWNPSRLGESVTPEDILVMSVFGVFTTPLWPTYIPAIILTPIMMGRIAASEAFMRFSMPTILGVSFVVGAIAGVGVISIIVPWRGATD